jgi:CheY-like chemotaxis protein
MIELRNEVRGRPAELLLIEDNGGDVLLAREAFREVQVANNLSVARDGAEALSMLRRERLYAEQPKPDLILLDLSLPYLSGGEVLSAIKADPALQTIPVIVLTGSRAAADVRTSYARRANGYIVKPDDFEHLRGMVASIATFWLTFAVLPNRPAFERQYAH